MVTRHFLNREKCRKLEDWCVANHGENQANRFTSDELAVAASAALGFEVTKKNLTSAYDTMNLKLPCYHSKAGGSKFASKSDMVVIAGNLVTIMKQLDVTVPQELLDIAASDC